MTPDIHDVHSVALARTMLVAAYGRTGMPWLAFPPVGSDQWEYENQGAIHALEPALDAGRLTLCTLQSLDREALLDRAARPEQRSRQQRLYDAYVRHEVIPFVRSHFGSVGSPLGTIGVDFGAFHAVNTLLKQPDLVKRCLALSGIFDVTGCMDGAFDEDFYFNNPLHYLQNITKADLLRELASCRVTLMVAGTHADRRRESYRMAGALQSKGVVVDVEDWGEAEPGWPLWKHQLQEKLGG